MLFRSFALAVIALSFLSLGVPPATAADFGTLLGVPRIKAPKGMPSCPVARSDAAKYAYQHYCWNGQRAERTWPKGPPVDQVRPAPQPPQPPQLTKEQIVQRHRAESLKQLESLPQDPGSQSDPLSAAITGVVVRTFKDYQLTRNAALRGHDTKTQDGLELITCADTCNKDPWCRSFDYNWFEQKCVLSNKTSTEVALRFDIPGNPWDHFERRPPKATATPADNAPAPLLTPTTVCRKFLKGPNPWRNNEAKEYPPAVTDVVCGPLESSTKPAECFHYLMSGQVAWDSKGMSQQKPNTYTRWAQQNAADLCAGTPYGVQTVQCFGLHISRHRDWRDATARCKANTSG